MLETGRILQDRYRVEKQVGQGGMGSVYLATDQRFHSTVAIKETLFGDEKFRKAFAREARLLNSLKHSALPKVTDHFIEDQGQYIVMEYIGGDDLFEMMRKSGEAFPVDMVIEWADQLLDALSYLHEQRIIHRDIKPQNLKLTPQNKIILLDFGLAKGNPTDANFQTAPQSIFGYSRNYASLEQIQGTGTDPRSDIYSLAATIYHLITAQVPADALTRVMMVLNENNDPLEPAGKFNSLVSQEVSDALQVCLSLKAGSRPQNVDEMRKILINEIHTPFMSADPDKVTIAGRGDLLTQNTMVFDQQESSVQDKRSELKTEVLGASPGSESIKTKLSNQPTNPMTDGPEKAKRGARLALAAAGAAMLLIVSSVAAVVYLWPVGGTPALPVANSNISDSFLLEDQENPENSNINTGVELVDESLANESQVDQNPDKSPAEKGRPETREKTAKAGSVSDAAVGAEEVIIGNGTIRTRDTAIDQKGTVTVKTPAPTINLRLTREQLRKLTPAQRRRLLLKIESDRRAAEQRRREQMKQNPPQPPEPPPPLN